MAALRGSGIGNSSNQKIFKDSIQAEAATTEVPGGRILDTDSSLVLFGSFGRYEMVSGSDCDWTLLINGVVNNRHAEDARLIHRAIETARLEDPGAGGAFGKLCFSHEMVHKIGGPADSNENITRRILMLLESRALSVSPTDSSLEVRKAVVRSILERYFEEDVHFSRDKKVPRFLLNDLTRYWRTICVDYAAKHLEQDGAKWAIRNAKLRLSRKLLYAAGLAFCFRCQLSPPTIGSAMDVPPTEFFINSAMEFADTPPLEYLAAFIDDFLNGENRALTIDCIFEAYDRWLALLGDAKKREHLKTLDHSSAKEDEIFGEVRHLGGEFAKGLKLLFFGRYQDIEERITNLSLEYVGF